MTPLQLFVGDAVRRVQKNGSAEGPLLTIRRIYPRDPHAVCELSDGRHEPECNLEKYQIDLN
jgi:hypothetical protein